MLDGPHVKWSGIKGVALQMMLTMFVLTRSLCVFTVVTCMNRKTAMTRKASIQTPSPLPMKALTDGPSEHAHIVSIAECTLC